MEASCPSRRNIRICFSVIWDVEFIASGGGKMTAAVPSSKKFGSYLKAHDHGESRGIGAEAKCYYNRESPNEARWEAPKDKMFLGFIVAGCILFLAGCTLIWCLHVLNSRQAEMKLVNDTVELL